MATTISSISVVSIILILGSLGFLGLNSLTDSNVQNAYVCESTKQVQIFNGGLSATLTRGYPTAGTTKGYVDCILNGTKTKWILLSEYVKTLNLPADNVTPNDISQVVPGILNTAVWGKKYICSNNCTEVTE